MMVIGAADINGQAWVSSQLAELEVADRYVTFDMKRSACDKGQPTQIQCTLAHNTPFEGKAKAELLGLPPGVSADPVEFTKETKELAFQVKTTKDTPVGSHKSLFCQITITQNGEPIVCTVGTTELQVNEPPAAAPAPAPKADAAKPATPPPAAKPLSRLEQLRAKAHHQDGQEAMNEIALTIIAICVCALASRRFAARHKRQQRTSRPPAQPKLHVYPSADLADDRSRFAIRHRSSRVSRRHHARCDRQSDLEARPRRSSSRAMRNRFTPKADGDAKLTVPSNRRMSTCRSA